MKIEEIEKELTYKAKHVYEEIDEKEKEFLEKVAKDYIEFLSIVKTERETVEFGKELLEKEGF
ncbi:MAG: Aspartyl aminopeptidase [Thermodesulfobacteria bacterium]|nr:hypothetical protein [Thermodesulfobacteriota bacterium]MCU4139056.1 Aspartyl aminopeptidase [Thermodesulfobacteriota bacterium]